MHRDAEPAEHPRPGTVRGAEHAHQEVPGAEVAVAAPPRVLEGERDGAAGRLVQAVGRFSHRMARLMAETTALSDALTIEPSMPTPQSTVSSTAHST